MSTRRFFQCDPISPNITAILGNRQDADDTVYRGKNGDTGVPVGNSFDGFTDCRIFQLIGSKTVYLRAVHRNTAQRRRAVVLKPTGVSHDFNFGNGHTVRPARSVLMLYRNPERYGVDHFFKSIQIFRAKGIGFNK